MSIKITTEQLKLSELEFGVPFALALPVGATFLHMQNVLGFIQVWFQSPVDPNDTHKNQIFVLHPITVTTTDDKRSHHYLGTAQTTDGQVFHLFKLIDRPQPTE